MTSWVGPTILIILPMWEEFKLLIYHKTFLSFPPSLQLSILKYSLIVKSTWGKGWSYPQCTFGVESWETSQTTTLMAMAGMSWIKLNKGFGVWGLMSWIWGRPTLFAAQVVDWKVTFNNQGPGCLLETTTRRQQVMYYIYQYILHWVTLIIHSLTNDLATR